MDVYEKKNEKNGQPYAGDVHDGSVSYGLRLGEGEQGGRKWKGHDHSLVLGGQRRLLRGGVFDLEREVSGCEP